MSKEMIETLVKRWIKPGIRALSAYHVADAKGLIKLDAMENPYTWPEGLRREWLELLVNTDVNRYPHPQAPEVKDALRRTMSIPEQADLVLGNGSDELIQMIAMSVGGPGRCLLSVEPTFVMYRMIAAFLDLDYVGVPLRRDDFSMDLNSVLTAVREHQPAVIFLAYPNNPTGNLFDQDDLRSIVEAAPGLVVIDEAYAPFTEVSMLSMVGRYDNLLVMRTVSKMGLAGLRLGLLVGPSPWLEQIDKTRLPYNINILTQISAAFALRHQAVFDQQTEAIRRARDLLFKALRSLPGVEPLPSQANFILLRIGEGRALECYRRLRERGILVKNLHGTHATLEDCLRVTVGTPEENSAFLEALKALL